MQTDFHHSVMYVLARLAGFDQNESGIIAYASQYVDDAINTGTVRFDNGALYDRISSAHRTLDTRNFNKLANHLVWIPFHFLPGNEGKAAAQNPHAPFIQKIICQADSPVARDVVRAGIRESHKPYALHRLGIALHAYTDSWAHKNFAGVCHEVNAIKRLEVIEGLVKRSWAERLRTRMVNLLDDLISVFISQGLPLGHSPALSYPDLPFLKQWRYTNGLNQTIVRENLNECIEAAQATFRMLRNFRENDPDLGNTEDINAADLNIIAHNLEHFTDMDSGRRHASWLKAIAEGAFSFGAETLDYQAKGRESWKHAALGTECERDRERDRHTFEAAFFNCHWKLFHDALQSHRLEVMRDILPRYGICAA